MKLILLILATALSISASEWSTNIVLMAIETNHVMGYMRVMRPATFDEVITSWFSNGVGIHSALLSRELPPAPPTNGQGLGGLTVDIPGFTNWNVPKTNSFLAHPERKRKVMAYRKECPECGVTLTSTNITSWLVTEETNSFRMVSVTFECLGCDETYVETFRKPIRKTKVEEIAVEVVK